MVLALQEALLPPALPVLPRARIAARYLPAGQEQAAGGDWFDAVPLTDGTVALMVGDVVGHGIAASAAMGQLRSVLDELLAAEPDLGTVLTRQKRSPLSGPRSVLPPWHWRSLIPPMAHCATPPAGIPRR